MDPKIRDESRHRRREEALARQLGEALDQTDLRGTEVCPDAELIAAYNERALGPEEAAQCENHFAACSRCRKILAVLAASADTPLAEKEVARLGELVAGARAPREAAKQPAIPPRSNLLHWRARWLAPALGVAAVLAVWFAMKPPWRPTDQSSSTTLIAQAPQSEPAPPDSTSPVDQFSKTGPTQNRETNSTNPRGNLKDLPATKTESGKAAAETTAKNGLDTLSATGGLAPKAKVAEGAPADEKKEQATMNSAMATALAPAPSSASPPPAGSFVRPLARAQSNSAGRATPSAPQAPGSENQSVTGEAPPVASAGSAVGGTTARDKEVPPPNTTNVILGPTPEPVGSNLPLNGRNFQSLSIVDPAKEPTFQIRAPSGKVLWRAGKGGHIDGSPDAGSTWILATSPLQDDWLSGAAASDKVCWIVGRNGAIARTVDGEHWEKIAPPPMSADASGKFPDWIDVKATGAEVATITAKDQRHYSTQDGGKTWQ